MKALLLILSVALVIHAHADSFPEILSEKELIALPREEIAAAEGSHFLMEGHVAAIARPFGLPSGGKYAVELQLSGGSKVLADYSEEDKGPSRQIKIQPDRVEVHSAKKSSGGRSDILTSGGKES